MNSIVTYPYESHMFQCMDQRIFDLSMLLAIHIQPIQHIPAYNLVANQSYSVDKHTQPLHLWHGNLHSDHLMTIINTI